MSALDRAVLTAYFAAAVALSRRINAAAALDGLATGMAANAFLRRAAPGASWLWRNPTGFFSACIIARSAGLFGTAPDEEKLRWALGALFTVSEECERRHRDYRTWLLLAALILVLGIIALPGAPAL